MADFFGSSREDTGFRRSLLGGVSSVFQGLQRFNEGQKQRKQQEAALFQEEQAKQKRVRLIAQYAGEEVAKLYEQGIYSEADVKPYLDQALQMGEAESLNQREVPGAQIPERAEEPNIPMEQIEPYEFMKYQDEEGIRGTGYEQDFSKRTQKADAFWNWFDEKEETESFEREKEEVDVARKKQLLREPLSQEKWLSKVWTGVESGEYSLEDGTKRADTIRKFFKGDRGQSEDTVMEMLNGFSDAYLKYSKTVEDKIVESQGSFGKSKDIYKKSPTEYFEDTYGPLKETKPNTYAIMKMNLTMSPDERQVLKAVVYEMPTDKKELEQILDQNIANVADPEMRRRLNEKRNKYLKILRTWWDANLENY